MKLSDMEEADGPLVFAHACKLGLEGLQDHSSIDGGSAERSAPGTTADALDIDVAFALGTGALAKLLDAALAESSPPRRQPKPYSAAAAAVAAVLLALQP